MVLSIIGLAVIHSDITRFLAAVAAVCVGVALFSGAGAVVAHAQQALTPAAAGAERGSGLGLQFLGGIAGVVLGILALLNVAPMILMAAAAIALGAAMMLTVGAVKRFSRWSTETTYGGQEMARLVAREMVEGATGTQVLSGLAAVVLGIIALSGLVPMTLVLAAFLCLGASALLSGGALTERIFSLMTR